MIPALPSETRTRALGLSAVGTTLHAVFGLALLVGYAAYVPAAKRRWGYYVLPILMTVTMVLQTKMNPVPPDPVQAKVMQFMPFIFSIFFFFFPAGLVLYWLINNVLSIAQQWQITRMLEREAARRKN